MNSTVFIKITEKFKCGAIINRTLTLDDFLEVIDAYQAESGSKIELPLDFLNPNQIKNTPDMSKFAVLVDGKVTEEQLPSYVDDVLEYETKADFPETGETGKIYVELSTNKSYRWSGSTYVAVNSGLALGETEATAYAGSKGKKNADDIVEIKATLNNLPFVVAPSKGEFPELAEANKDAVYLSLADKNLYTVGENGYVPWIPALGDEAGQAFPGERGKALEAFKDSFAVASETVIVDAMLKDAEAGKTVVYGSQVYTVGTNAFASISAAVAVGIDGKTVMVYPGTYSEDVTVTGGDVKLVGLGHPNVSGMVKLTNCGTVVIKDINFLFTARKATTFEDVSSLDWALNIRGGNGDVTVENVRMTVISTGAGPAQTAAGTLFAENTTGNVTVQSCYFANTLFTPSNSYPKKSIGIYIGAKDGDVTVSENKMDIPVCVIQGTSGTIKVLHNQVYSVGSSCIELGTNVGASVQIVNNVLMGEDVTNSIKFNANTTHPDNFMVYVTGNVASSDKNFFGNASATVFTVNQNVKFFNNIVVAKNPTLEEVYPVEYKVAVGNLPTFSTSSTDIENSAEAVASGIVIDGSTSNAFRIEEPSAPVTGTVAITFNNFELFQPVYIVVEPSANSYTMNGVAGGSFNAEAGNYTNAVYRVTKLAEEDYLVELLRFVPEA